MFFQHRDDNTSTSLNELKIKSTIKSNATVPYFNIKKKLEYIRSSIPSAMSTATNSLVHFTRYMYIDMFKRIHPFLFLAAFYQLPVLWPVQICANPFC